MTTRVDDDRTYVLTSPDETASALVLNVQEAADLLYKVSFSIGDIRRVVRLDIFDATKLADKMADIEDAVLKVSWALQDAESANFGV